MYMCGRLYQRRQQHPLPCSRQNTACKSGAQVCTTIMSICAAIVAFSVSIRPVLQVLTSETLYSASLLGFWIVSPQLRALFPRTYVGG